MIRLCIRCQWADVTMDEETCTVFCQVTIKMVNDIADVCGRYKRRENLETKL